MAYTSYELEHIGMNLAYCISKTRARTSDIAFLLDLSIEEIQAILAPALKPGYRGPKAATVLAIKTLFNLDTGDLTMHPTDFREKHMSLGSQAA